MAGEAPTPTPAAATDALAPAAAATHPAATAPPAGTGGLLGADGAKPEAEAVKPEPAKTEPPKPAPIELKLPDGFQADDKTLGAFKATAGELGLKSEQAQKLFDLFVSTQASAQQATAAGWEKTVSEWESTARSDKEYGGANFDTNLEVARNAITRLGSPELRDFLFKSGLGNHPEILRFAYRAGKSIQEDRLGDGPRGPAQLVPSAADLQAQMYPSMFSKKE